jgi:hypothetical protein
MRGRHAIGPEIAERVTGSAQARQRTRVVLETIAHIKRVTEACAELGICEQRFETIREEIIQGSVTAAEPGHAGRPRQEESAADARVAELEREKAVLIAENQALRVRVELAEGLPRLAGKKS